jgi:SAM-dependent methyltransferase
MTIPEDVRAAVLAQAQGAMALDLAFIGISSGVLAALSRAPATSDALARELSLDAVYVARYADAAYAFGLLEASDGGFSLTELGRAFLPDAPGTLMPLAVGAVLGAHMTERAAGLMRTGERPGESVLAERATILPWFGPMLEATFAPVFEREVLSHVPAFAEVAARGGLAVDLGCGNGWYLRALARRFPGLRGVGLDGFEENVRQATALARAQGLGDRLAFQQGDIYDFTVSEPVDLVAMSRALHHVWDQKERVFSTLRDVLRPGGFVVIWEPAWPERRESLRDPRRRPMAFQNLGEHVQGNHFLRPEEIEAAFRAVGMKATTYAFADGAEAIIVAEKPR